MKTFKAIETKYKGYCFRSRLEARWATFLDALDEEWEYEKEGFELSAGRYLPDFWLPRLEMWLEIKGGGSDARDFDRAEELSAKTQRVIAIAEGLPNIDKPRPDRSRLIVYCEHSRDTKCEFCDPPPHPKWERGCFWAFDSKGRPCVCTGHLGFDNFYASPGGRYAVALHGLTEVRALPDLYLNVAKQARFNGLW